MRKLWAIGMLVIAACGSAEGQTVSGAAPAWRDASGTLVSRVLNITSTEQGFEHYVLHQDPAGALWYTSVRTGEIVVPSVTRFWTSSNCSGAAYVDVDFPGAGAADYQLTLFPRVVFRAAGDAALRAIADDTQTTTISPMSRDTGSGCVAMSGGGGGLSSAEMVPLADTTPASMITQPGDFTGPLHIE